MDPNGQSKYPVKFIKTLPGNTAHVILFSDGKKYVVKWKGSKIKRAKEVVNEYVVGKLATLLSLPVVPFDLVYIPDEFIKNTSELQPKKKYYFNPGCQYSCLFIENSIVLEDVFADLPSKTDVQNHNMLAKMAVFDQWVNNFDRTMSNLLLERLDEGESSFYVHMIDHGRCFPGGYTWSQNTLTQKLNYENNGQETYRWIFSILNKEDFTSFVDKIVNLPNESIYEIIESIPEEWEVSKEEREALYNFLIGQKKDLPNIIDNFIDQYNRNISNKKEKSKDKKKKKKKEKNKK